MEKKNLFRDRWKDYFSFPKRLRNGLFVLFSLVVLEIAVLLWIYFTPYKNKPIDLSQFQKEIDKFYTSVQIDSAHNDAKDFHEQENDITEVRENSNAKTNPTLFAFNPNNLPEWDWKRLGFSDKQIHVIKNYESKGGKFRSKDDVRKMYCINDEEYSMIEPYINIPPQQLNDTTSHKSIYKKYDRSPLIVDIGTADTLELLKLPAIGPSFARRISNYRDKLGGFYSVNQLKEVWGLSDSIFQIISPHISLNDSTNIRRINVNTADYKEFKRHPYIDKILASVITSYRNQHGSFHSMEDIRKVPLFNEELYCKLAPYLKIE
jgi:DNA uptake protein ComE-like DNA-binding protein